MEDSILNDVKKVLGVPEDLTVFDQDIILHINSTFMVLHQLGVGTPDVFSISGKDETWSSFLSNARTVNDLNAVKTYIYLKLRILFDPPSSSYVLSALESQASELEWRLNIQAERSDGV